MKTSLFRDLIESGVRQYMSPSTKRVIILSNYIALTLAAANLLLYFIIPGDRNTRDFLQMSSGVVIFLFPLLLNRWQFTLVSRIYECWLPTILIFWLMSRNMKAAESVSTAYYDGLRFYLLATSSIPYLLLERKNLWLLLICIFPGLIAILFCDPILDLVGAGFDQKGIHDSGYEFTTGRSFVAYLIINGCGLSLKMIVNASDLLNEKLLSELNEKNKLFQTQSAERLKESEHKYQSLFEQASDGIVITDLKGQLVDCNPKICHLLGYTREELLTFNISDLIGNEQLKERPIPFDQLSRGEHVFNERRMICKSGLLIDVEASVKQMEGNLILGLLRDTSQRKKIERELIEAEAKFRNLVEQSLVGVYILKNGRYAYVNPQFAAIFGYEQSELINNYPLEIVVHPDDRIKVKENIALRLRGEKDSVRYELKGIKKNGEIIWTEVFGSITQYEGGPAIIGTAIDITDRKKSEDQRALFASLVNSSEDAIISNTTDGTITSWNRGATKLFGYNAEEVIGKHISILIPHSRLKEEEEIVQKVSRQESIEHFETERLKKNGDSIHISLTVSPVVDSTGNNIGISRIARDITERKQIEKDKDKARYQLKERIKELNTLYRASQILQAERMTIEDVIQEIANILPAGWQYPENSAARIVVGPQEFVTVNYEDRPQKQYAEFKTSDGFFGSIEVVYLKKMPESDEGPFLKEERNLINMLAEMLRVYLTRKQEADSLKKSEASLNAIINNTGFFIWSVNTNYELQNCNKPFRQFINEKFGTSVQDGQSIVELYEQGIFMEVFEPRWIELYKQALAGQSFSLEEEQAGRNFKFSLNPIIENEMVTGVSVFSEETTVLKRKEKELLDANKQIGDLKLMALRAAMNPHFIFNTLNSIQYYIMENDQRKAVNYLSTFSKLIRGILNNSVQTKVKLTEELEMLKHYVTLEQMRFENKFDFVLDVEQDLDIDDIEIPSMLIQPYVENAILHGINNKPGHGNLKIAVRNHKDGVLFEVEDDGIGRKATQKLHSENHSQHKSFGTALTEERLKIINSQSNISSEIIDLEKDEKPAGTRVKIWINE